NCARQGHLAVRPLDHSNSGLQRRTTLLHGCEDPATVRRGKRHERMPGQVDIDYRLGCRLVTCARFRRLLSESQLRKNEEGTNQKSDTKNAYETVAHIDLHRA